MKIAALIYTALMLSTFIWVPYQLPIPKIGGTYDAGYHLTCAIHEDSSSKYKYSLACRKPYLQPGDSQVIDKVLSIVGLTQYSDKNIPIKYRINYLQLIAEWLFISFLTLIWMLAFQFSKTPNKNTK